ncbi:type VII secretion protein EccB, partial [Streptomyces sp. WAC06614]|uniref:type VII secretion protein EccB n=1 Tax=Streptomyces sp. WAC06614 TaxID=2487416 RepID=UPI000F7A30DA
MQSRRDQVQAHLFVMGRLTTGMLRGEPDEPDPIGARTTKGVWYGLLVALLVALVVTVYGVVRPGGATGWRQSGTLVTVKGSGARFLYVEGRLHPVLNETSARLLAGDRLRFEQVDVRSLGDTPRGDVLGIVGAPDAPPRAEDLTSGAWTACATRRTTGTGESGARLTLAIGLPAGGRALAGQEGVLIAGPDGRPHLLWQGMRLALDPAAGATAALGYDAAVPVPVTAAFLDTLRAGPALAAPAPPGRGEPGPALAGSGSRIGRMYGGPTGERYVLTREGLVPLTETGYRLLLADPATQREAYGGGAVQPARLEPADLAAHRAPAGAARALAQGLPAEPPRLAPVDPDQAVCAGLRPRPDGPVTSVLVLPAAAVDGRPPVLQPGVTRSCAEADLIAVRPGGGALVRALSGAGQGGTSY